jgi:hypothetical protein
MSQKIPLKQTHEKSKWITATLLCIYLLITVFLFMNA